jgi:hypothetical protein
MVPSKNCCSVSPSPSAVGANRIHEDFHPADAVVERTRPFVSIRVAVATFVGAGALIGGVSHLCNFPVVDGLVIYSVLGLPILIACISSRVMQTRQSQPRSMTLADHIITFSTSAETESCPVQACCWFYGKATDDPGLSYQDIRQKALLIVFPSGRTIACGLTRPFYSQWLSALRLHHCRHVYRQEGPLGVLFSALAIGGFIAGGCFGQTVGGIIRDSLFQPPQNNQFANLLPAALFVLGAWCGAVMPWFIPGWRRYTEGEHQQFERFAIGLPAKVAVLAGAFVAGNLFTGLLFVLFFATVLLLLTPLVSEQLPWPVRLFPKPGSDAARSEPHVKKEATALRGGLACRMR